MMMKVVTAAIIIEHGKVLLCQRAKDDPLSSKWEFPGGKVELGESAEQGLLRELAEELGVTARIVGHFCDSSYLYPAGGILLKCYTATLEACELQLLVHQAFAWAAMDDLLSYDLLPADIPVAQKIIQDMAE